jgi:putative lipoic acid-binding regulatory protein
MSNEEVFEFPCDFPLKVMGRTSPSFRGLVVQLIERHAGEISAERVEERNSKDGNFVSVTVTVHAQSKQQLDSIYRELTACKDILYVL